MMQLGFTTDIERRSPFTGNVFMIDRMTSDWAEAHPFDVDGYIHEVALKYGADEERVRLFFNYGLGKKGERWATHCPAKHRDKERKDPKTGVGLLTMGKWPDYVNGCEPALIEAWHKASEYHSKGLRLGDTLPQIVPSCKITRLEDGGWIALFPKDMNLLNNIIQVSEATAAPDLNQFCSGNANDAAPAAAGASNTKANITTDLTLGGAVREDSEPIFEKPKRRKKKAAEPQPQQLELFDEQDDEPASRKLLRGAGYLAAASVAIIIVYQTGLIIPLGLIGLATSGLLR